MKGRKIPFFTGIPLIDSKGGFIKRNKQDAKVKILRGTKGKLFEICNYLFDLHYLRL